MAGHEDERGRCLGRYSEVPDFGDRDPASGPLAVRWVERGESFAQLNG